MSSTQKYFLVWLSGLVTGFMLMERWRRTGGVQVPEADNAREPVEPNAVDTSMEVSAGKPRVSAVIVAGAKTDAERARALLARVMPWASTSTPSLAQLRRTGQTPMPGSTPD
jgi:hypothetical protein